MDLFHVQRRRHGAAEVHVVARRLRVVELGDLEVERQHLEDLEPRVGGERLGHRAVDGLDDVELAGLQRGELRGGVRHEAEHGAVDVDVLASGEPVAVLVVGVRHVVGEALDGDVAVRHVFDELERPGADEGEVLERLHRLFLGIDGDRRARRGEVVDEGGLQGFQLHRHFQRPGGLDRIHGARAGWPRRRTSGIARARPSRRARPWSCRCGTSPRTAA